MTSTKTRSPVESSNKDKEPFSDSTDLGKFEHVKGRLVEFVKYDNKFAPLAWQFLGRCLLVDSVESAMDLVNRLGREYKFVTTKGELVTIGGSVKLGPLSKAAGLISRKSRIRQLQEIITNMEAEITELEQQSVDEQILDFLHNVVCRGVLNFLNFSSFIPTIFKHLIDLR